VNRLVGTEHKRQVLKAYDKGAVGIELALAPVVGFFGGRWLDGLFGTEPVIAWVGLVAGILAGFRSLYRLVRQTRRELMADERPADERPADERPADERHEGVTQP
jgi:F0F1-type ATP synthase assembly protein I